MRAKIILRARLALVILQILENIPFMLLKWRAEQNETLSVALYSRFIEKLAKVVHPAKADFKARRKTS